jgi:hypothetical protein
VKRLIVFLTILGCVWLACDSNNPSGPNYAPISISYPLAGADVSDTVNIRTTIGDNYTFARVDFYIDDDSVATDSTLPFSYKWYTGNYLHNSHHILQAFGFGSENHHTDTMGVRVVIPGGPLAILEPLSGTVISSPIRIIARQAAAYTFHSVAFLVNGDSVGFDSTAQDTTIGVPTKIFTFTLSANNYPDNSILRLTAKGTFNSITYQSSPETVYTALNYLPDTLEYLAFYSTAAPALRVASEGGHLYIATGGNAVLGVNITNPGSPSPEFTISSPGQAEGLDIDYPYLSVAFGDDGVKRYNVSNPGSIQNAGVLNTPGFSWNTKALGNLLFVADNDAVQIASVSSSAISQLATVNMTGGLAKDVDAWGQLVIAIDNSGASLIDVSTPGSPVVRSRYAGINGIGQCAAIIDSFVFVGTTAELVKLSVADPDTLKFISRMATSYGITGVFANETAVFVSLGTSSGGAMALDYKSGAAMITINQFMNGDNCHDICAFGPYVFLAGQTKVDILRFIR